MNTKWKGTIILGVIGVNPNTITCPSSAILLRRPCWIATHDYVNVNGVKYQSKYADILNDIHADTVITLTLTYSGSLTLTVGQKQLDEFATGLPHHVYPVFDLYGKCERISILHNEPRNGTPINEELTLPTTYDAGGSGDGAMVPASSSNNMHNEDIDRNVPQCEKADLEVHEKETDISLPSIPDAMAAGGSGSVM